LCLFALLTFQEKGWQLGEMVDKKISNVMRRFEAENREMAANSVMLWF
jgi:hypothetical protein